MAVRKIRDSWWVDFRFEGMRYRKRCPDNSVTAAKTYESVLRQKLVRGESLEPKAVDDEYSFSRFSEEWFLVYVQSNNKHSEIRGKKYILTTHLVPFLGQRKLDSINVADIERYKAKKLSEGLCAKTVNNHLAVLGKCLRTAVDWGHISSCPKIKKLKTISERVDFLSQEESTNLLTDGYEPMWGEMAHLALRTGMRQSELIGLEWQDIDFERRQLTVQHSIVMGIRGMPKSNKIRHIPLTQDICSALHKIRRSNGLVFCRGDGIHLSKWNARSAIHRMCKRAGIRLIGWHTLRHTFASHLAIAGIPLHAVQSLLGHSTIVMTMRYAHLAPSTLRDAVSVLEKGFSASPPNFGQPMGNMTKMPSYIGAQATLQ